MQLSRNEFAAHSARMMPAQRAADNVVEVLRDATKH